MRLFNATLLLAAISSWVRVRHPRDRDRERRRETDGDRWRVIERRWRGRDMWSKTDGRESSRARPVEVSPRPETDLDSRSESNSREAG